MSVENFNLPAPLIAKFNEVLDGFAGVGQEANRSNNDAFIKELKKRSADLMQFVDFASQKDDIMQQLT